MSTTKPTFPHMLAPSTFPIPVDPTLGNSFQSKKSCSDSFGSYPAASWSPRLVSSTFGHGVVGKGTPRGLQALGQHIPSSGCPPWVTGCLVWLPSCPLCLWTLPPCAISVWNSDSLGKDTVFYTALKCNLGEQKKHSPKKTIEAK